MEKSSKTQTNLARRLRRRSTPAEQTAWNMLRNWQLDDLKFYRQYPVGSYIVDFCCRTYSLMIEIDGGVHVRREVEDSIRERYLEEKGYHIIRFTNDQIFNDINQVAEVIRSVADSLKE